MSSVNDVGRVLDGLTPRRVQQLVAQGVLPAPKEKGVYDLLACVLAYIRYLKKQIQGGGEVSLVDARTRLAKEQADKMEMENRRIRGETINVVDAVRPLEAVVTSVRQKILGMGDRLSPRVVGCNNIAEVKKLIDDYAAEVLHDIVQIDPVRAVESGQADSIGSPDGGAPAVPAGERMGGREQETLA